MSLTPDQFRKVGLGVTPSPSPFLTPRPERRRMDLRQPEWNAGRQDRDKEVNVQVLLRCRPLNEDEQKMNVPKAISCNENRREVTVLQSFTNKQVDRVFTFDKVFGPKAQQRSIYDQAIAPIVNEVLDGFNCTIFAYGQTGTGKTYTMEGGMRNKAGELPAEAGVIPRAVRQFFDTLEAQNADYSMKVTFLELYNEEVADLLASEDSPRYAEDRQKKPISLMEDGKGCVVVRGLEEVAVYSANEIYSLLERGAAKRRTADTLLNKRSSRSHSVFSITVYIKEAAVGDEDLIKCGKLNLVDLAGSENISRSGAREARAKEAGEINKSLLTLGRVINALVEHSPHIPYRDSKLTRLLRDSLGGKTKTCIIATISPSAHCLDETLSTLDYAYRAKNIKNKPEANQKMSKAVLLKDLYAEIERMREDIRAAREKNGVYIPHERFAQEEAEKKLRNERIEELESNLTVCEKQIESYRELYLNEQEQKLDVDSLLKNCKVDLEKSNKALLDLQEKHRLAISLLKEKEFVISKLCQSENSLIGCAKDLRSELQCASEDISSLFMKLDEKNKMEAENHNTVLTFGSQLDQSLKNLHRIILRSVSHQQQQIRCMEEHFCSFLASKHDATEVLQSKIGKMMETHNSGIASLNDFANSLQVKASSDLVQINSTKIAQKTAIEKFIHTLALEAKEVIGNIQSSLHQQKELLDFSARQQEEGLHRGLASARVMAEATVDFVNDLYSHASEVMKVLHETQIEKADQLTKFKKTFKEEAAQEEKLALQQVAAILATLTSKRTKMVSEATKSMNESNKHESKRLHGEMCRMQKLSDDTRNELTDYMAKVEKCFYQNTFSAAESRAVMGSCLQNCLKEVDYSKQQWENAESGIDRLGESSLQQIECVVKEKINTNEGICGEFMSMSSLTDREFSARVNDMLVAINDSLMRDRECKEKMDSMTSQCIDQLKLVPEKHRESISDVRSKAEQCFTKDYQVDEDTGSIPKKRSIQVPNLATIEDMRMSFCESLDGENMIEKKLRSDDVGTKTQQLHQEAVSPLRTPFADVN
ncbi:kinesin-like protein KIN-5B [Punica granatum]|uniref:Kinesin-like protein KIN-5B n=1 Tax=Punica granatum TaxID=22663 RepID=A0A6P8DYA1_PUNGR|nr:kinesin-like protein KIN-5B [Punica granatum]XP_031399314.1 kinesin-like protein KIN-5B [Punica granatum]